MADGQIGKTRHTSSHDLSLMSRAWRSARNQCPRGMGLYYLSLYDWIGKELEWGHVGKRGWKGTSTEHQNERIILKGTKSWSTTVYNGSTYICTNDREWSPVLVNGACRAHFVAYAHIIFIPNIYRIASVEKENFVSYTPERVPPFFALFFEKPYNN